MIGSMFRKAWYSDSATLNLDFTSGVLDSRLTFTRAANTATVINSSGYVQTVNADVPRFDYDPTTLAPKGLLIEAAATNRALRSNDFNTTVTDGTQWIVSGYTRGDVSTTLPDGTTGNACRISGTGSASFRTPSIAVNASTAYTFSFWARNNGGSQARYRVWNATASSSIVDYTLSGSNYVSQIGGANNTSTTWVRVSVTFTTPVGCTSIFVYPTSSDTGTVDVLLWGAQVEEGSGASSYIPTTASSATRNADECQILDLTTFGFNASEGTIYTDVGQRRNTGSQRNYTFLPASGSNNQIFEGSGWTLNVYSSGSFVAQIGTSLLSASRIAAVYKVNDYAVSINGAAVVTDTSGAVPSSLTKLTIGGSIANAAAYANGHIRVFKYWPTRLPNATLQSLTT